MPTDRETSSLAAQLAELDTLPPIDASRRSARQPVSATGSSGPRSSRDGRTRSHLGAALAYRIFIWLLPFALTLILLLALVAGRGRGNVAEVIADAGLTGFVATSVASAADGTSGWALVSALVVTLFVLAYQSSALLRSLRAVTALAWRVPITRVPNAARSSVLFLGWLVAFVLVASSAAPIRRALPFPLDLLLNLACYALGLPLLWLVLSWFLLPHGAVRWVELVPGALVVGLGVAAIGLFNALVLFPWLGEREETYGVLGVAAGLLFGFFLIVRTMELSAALNAVLKERRGPRTLAR